MITLIITYEVFFAAVYMTCVFFAKLADAIINEKGNLTVNTFLVSTLWTTFLILKGI